MERGIDDSRFADPKFTDNGGLHPNFADRSAKWVHKEMRTSKPDLSPVEVITSPAGEVEGQAQLSALLQDQPVCLSGLNSGCYDYELRANRLRRVEATIAQAVAR